ncbi:hypothetical protein P3T27_008195 [Kitasatospora sp. MAA19]|uniref:hypothetical protein n=1 Tax=Kitasatospora sp. MAA19 TaxID=3035090 RepID=UPI0024733A93|nr:hypothetical protein [Kitasatospora sp. MAA19]MDH6711437.1 hypothetical protein [Kitasatospora sp. MAA19]
MSPDTHDAVLNGGAMPGRRPTEVLHALDTPLRTHLDLLRTTRLPQPAALAGAG